MPSWLMPAARQRSRCFSTISRATVADIAVADAGVIRALRRRIAAGREAERPAVLVEEIFLLKAEPCAGIVEDGGALVGGMRGLAVGHHDFAHHQNAIGARAVRIDRDRLEHAVRAFGLRPAGSSFHRSPTAEAAPASGNELNSLICVLPRRFGVGVYPSSQIYSSLYFVIEPLMSLMLRNVENRSLVGHHHVYPATIRPFLSKQLKCQSLQCGSRRLRACQPAPWSFWCDKGARLTCAPEQPNVAFSARMTPDSPAVCADRRGFRLKPRQPSGTFAGEVRLRLQPSARLKRWSSAHCLAGGKSGNAYKLYIH